MLLPRNNVPKPIPALILALGGLLALAQEPLPFHPERPLADRDKLIRPGPPVRSSVDLRPKTKPEPKPAPGSLEHAREKSSLEHPNGQKPIDPAFFDWTRITGSQSSSAYKANLVTGGDSTPQPLKRGELDQLLSFGATIVNSGDVPNGKAWREFTLNHPGQLVTHEATSANRDRRSISEAVALADKPLNPATVTVFNALPRETDPNLSRSELTRMKIVGTTREWKLVNDNIEAASGGFSSHVATKKRFWMNCITGFQRHSHLRALRRQ